MKDSASHIQQPGEVYWDQAGMLATVVPTEVVLVVQSELASPPPVDVVKAQKLAALLARYR